MLQHREREGRGIAQQGIRRELRLRIPHRVTISPTAIDLDNQMHCSEAVPAPAAAEGHDALVVLLAQVLDIRQAHRVHHLGLALLDVCRHTHRVKRQTSEPAACYKVLIVWSLLLHDPMALVSPVSKCVIRVYLGCTAAARPRACWRS